MDYSQTPFSSFWMAGYECADHLNRYGNRVDLLKATAHIERLEEDYSLLSEFNIKTVREGVRWSHVERRPYQYDWRDFTQMLSTAKSRGAQQLWDLCHFGYPDDLSPLHPHFTRRFVAFCRSFVEAYRSIDSDNTILVTPFNEINFISWLGGEVAATSPFCVRQGWEVKYHLMRAYIMGIRAMKEMDGNLMIVSTEPLIHIVPPEDAGIDELVHTRHLREDQFQSMDILFGKICPELDGGPDLIDIIGLNFYYANQWEYRTFKPLPWAAHDRHPEWRPLHLLSEEIVNRYGKPIAITETSHAGEDRPLWIGHIVDECMLMLENGLPLLGLCIYPILDRPDWDHPDHYHYSGLWHRSGHEILDMSNILNEPYADAIRSGQRRLRGKLAERLSSLSLTGIN